MSLIPIIPGFVNQVQPPVLPVSQVKTEAPTVIKNELPDSEMMEIGVDNIFDSLESKEKIIADIKNIDIVWHPLCEDSIKSESVPENILASKYSEYVETSPFIKTENITQGENNNTKDISDREENRGTGQVVVEDQGINEHFNALGSLETNKQLVLNFSKNLNGICIRSRKAKHPKKTDFANCYKTVKTTSWEKDKEKVKVIEAHVVPIEPHEYTSLAKDEHVCNHCQHAFNRLCSLKFHITKMHREVTTMYQCPYCPFKSKWSVRQHIIQKHKDTKDIQWFQCHLCEKKFKFKFILTQHIKVVHLTLDQIQDRLELCLVCGKEFNTRSNKMERKCQKCKYTTTKSQLLQQHITSTYKTYKRYSCEKCAFVNRNYTKFKLHELSHKTKADMDDQDLKYRCDKCDYKTYRSANFKRHQLNHLKPEEIQYFHCHHCSYKSNQKEILKRHIFRYLKNGEFKHNETIIYKNQLETHTRKHEKRYLCDQCDFKTLNNQNLNRHKLSHLKPEEIQYFYCNHCSFKCQRKDYLKPHIFRHYKKEEIKFHCYICNFMTSKRELIIEHIKKHSKVQIKSEINEGN